MNNEKKIRGMIRKELPHFKLLFCFSFLSSIIIKLISLITGLLMKDIVDRWIPEGNLKNCLLYISLFIFIPVLLTISNAVYQYIVIVNGRNMSKRLSTLGFEKQVYQPLTYFDQNKSAELASYCRSESTKYILFWIMDVPRIFSSLISGIVVYIYIANCNKYFALAMILYIPILLLPNKFFSKKIEEFSKKIIKNNSIVNQIISDTFRAIKNVKSLSLEKVMVNRVYEVTSDTAETFAKCAATENLYGTWTNSFVDNLFTGLLFTLGAIGVINEKLSLGVLIIILNYLPVFWNSVKSISSAKLNYRKYLGEYDKFFDMLIMDDERQQDTGTLPFVYQDKLVFNNVSFSYTQERGLVLQNINFEISRGEWIGIMGHSGAGKSTVFDLLLKYYHSYSGEISVDGIDINKINTYELRKNITLVSQNLFLFPGTLKENLLLANPNASDQQINEVLSKVELSKFINKLPQGLDTNVGEDGLLISGGEKQRICLAQGLLRDSQVLLLDEVTANIDSYSEGEIRDTIQKLRLENHLTIISISHKADFLEKTNRILIFKGGSIEKVTTYADLSK